MSSSSAVPQCRLRVSELLSKLIATQSMDTRLWLRSEMVRLVDPMIDSLFLRLIISSSAQPSKQTNSHSTMSELCQLIEGEKETTNRLVRGQMDRLVNSLFLRLTNKALVNTEVSAFASVQPSPSNHQTVPPNASIAQSTMTNNSNEYLSTHHINSLPTPSANHDDEDEGEYIFDCEDFVNGICGLDCENDDADNDNAETGVDTMQIEVEHNASQKSDLMVMPKVIDYSNQSFDNPTDLYFINESEPQIGNVRKSLRNATKQKSENGQSDQIVIGHSHQSIPPTRGLRSSARKLSSQKVLRDTQFDVNVRKIEKRKSSQAMKNVKNGKLKQILDYGKETDSGGNDDQEGHVNNVIGEEFATECTTNPLQPNLTQQNRHLQCLQCHKSFDCNSKLERHLRVHTGERPFQCDLCDKRFKMKCNLMRHQLIHQNIKRFRCDQCDKRFTIKRNLDSHLLHIHLEERPFQCRHCAKSFATSNARNRHEQAIHLHVKPYRCKQCGYSSTERAAIIKHIRMIHFGLPRTIKEQRELNILDERDPGELVETV